MGQTEAPLTIRPYLNNMTRSELMTVMTSGMAHISGGIMGAYIAFGVEAKHLLAAVIMTAPGTILLAKMLVPETEQPETAGTVIEREARRLERLVGDLLDLARLRRRSFAVRDEVVDLGELALAAFQRYEARAGTFGVGLEVLAEPGAVALGDPDRILQAISNLVENALRSTPPQGTVRILAGVGRIDVVDDGPGLAPEDLDRAFERFYLYDRARDGRQGRRRTGAQ